MLQVKTAFVCGTDVRMFRNGHKGVSEESPLILGHELSGVIHKVGCQVKGYHEGQRVSSCSKYGMWGVCVYQRKHSNVYAGLQSFGDQ